MPRPKIQDQWTDRTDLSPRQKYYLRHPEKKKVGGWREWQEAHPDRYDEAQDRAANTLKLATVQKRNRRAAAAATNRNPRSARMSSRGEILALHAKGKCLVDICVWTNTPMSAVRRVLEQAGRTP